MIAASRQDPASPAAAPFRTRVAWVLLDWGASAFSTVLITLVVTYADKVVFVDRPWGFAPGVIWAWTMAAAMLAAALAGPWVAAWADRRHAHEQALFASVLAGSGGLFALGGVPPGAPVAVIACIVIACVGFEMAAIFTGSLLARIADGKAADRLSAAGFAAGYAGGAIALAAASALVARHEQLGLTTTGSLRLAFALTGLWWLVFSLPALGVRFADGAGERHAASSARELLDFARGLARPPDAGGADGRPLAAALVGAALVLGAVQTAIGQFSSLALEEFRLAPLQLVRLVLLVQAVALPGALAIGWLSTRFGRGCGVAVSLAGWLAVLALAWFVATVPQLFGLAVLLALVLGGIQSVIRATVADMAPMGRAAATFGILQVGTKLAGCAASLAFGAVYQASGSARAGLVMLAAQLVAGWWALRRR